MDNFKKVTTLLAPDVEPGDELVVTRVRQGLYKASTRRPLPQAVALRRTGQFHAWEQLSTYYVEINNGVAIQV